jgi:hypothetical protein
MIGVSFRYPELVLIHELFNDAITYVIVSRF